MCLPCTDDPAGCSPEVGTLEGGAPRGSPHPPPHGPLTPSCCREEGPSPGCWGVGRQKDEGRTGGDPVLSWLLPLHVLISKRKSPNAHVPSEKPPKFFIMGAYL